MLCGRRPARANKGKTLPGYSDRDFGKTDRRSKLVFVADCSKERRTANKKATQPPHQRRGGGDEERNKKFELGNKRHGTSR